MNHHQPCIHCEIASQENFYRLCKKCASVKGLRIVYKKPTWYTEEWDRHIQNLVELAKARIPLGTNPDYKGNPNYETPRHPRQRTKTEHDSMPRIVHMARHQKGTRNTSEG